MTREQEREWELAEVWTQLEAQRTQIIGLRATADGLEAEREAWRRACEEARSGEVERRKQLRLASQAVSVANESRDAIASTLNKLLDQFREGGGTGLRVATLSIEEIAEARKLVIGHTP